MPDNALHSTVKRALGSVSLASAVVVAYLLASAGAYYLIRVLSNEEAAIVGLIGATIASVLMSVDVADFIWRLGWRGWLGFAPAVLTLLASFRQGAPENRHFNVGEPLLFLAGTLGVVLLFVALELASPKNKKNANRVAGWRPPPPRWWRPMWLTAGVLTLWVSLLLAASALGVII